MKKNKVLKKFSGFILVFFLLIALVGIIFVLQTMQDSDYGSDKKEENEIVNTMKNKITFPILLEDGKLKIDSVFQFEGFNPDCNNQEGSDITGIVVKNISDVYLENADISMITNDGTILNFTVSNLPAGKTDMAFSKENEVSNENTVFGDVTCKASFNSEATLNEELITFSVNGTQIELQNNSDKELNEIVVYCHSTLGDQYFGGITYRYTINKLSSYGIIKIDAEDCILGLAEVVRIEIN